MPTRVVLATGAELTLTLDAHEAAGQLRLDRANLAALEAIGEGGRPVTVWINPAHVVFFEEGRASQRAEPPGI